MNTLENIAEDIREKSNIPKEEKFGSVIAILMIISIVLTLVRVLQECNKTKMVNEMNAKNKYQLYGSEFKEYSMRRGWFTKLRIKKVIRKQMSKDQYLLYGSALMNAVLDKGENLKEDEVITLVEASNV